MRRRGWMLFVGFLLLTSTSTLANAATSPPGVNIRWDQCYGDGGAWNRSFACDTNAGSDRLALSFELASPIDDVSAITFHVSLTTASPTLPAWWLMHGIGACRNGLSYNSFAPVGSANCVDWAAGGSVGGIGAYAQQYQSNIRVISGVVAVPTTSLMDLVPGVEYAMGTLAISHAKTVGTGSCSGCSTPACILFSDIEIETDTFAKTRITQGANWSGSALAWWQNGYAVDFSPAGTNSGGLFFPAVVRECVPYSTTSSKPSTWGAVKSLYR